MDLHHLASVSPAACCCFLGFLLATHLLHSRSHLAFPFPQVAAAAVHLSNETDRLALLRFKDEIIGEGDPLSSWNGSHRLCEWEGVTCSRRYPERVTALDLQSYSLVGRLSPHLSNLTFLISIDLSNNTFHGVIPAEIGSLSRLRYFYAANNTLSGEIPVNFSSCSELRELDLYGNKLSGNIPQELGSLSKLTELFLAHNNLTGRIPPSIANLSSLNILYLSMNRLEGSIPAELGQMTTLTAFAVFFNQLSGTVPSTVYNLSTLQELDLGVNRLQGNLPPHLFLTLPNLTWFSVGTNQYTGPMPMSLRNATGLQVALFNENYFKGLVPENLGSLQQLTILQINVNQLGSGGDGEGLGFLDSLANSSNLWQFDISNNSLSGALPDSVANLSTQLEVLAVSDNMIYGSIPSGIGNLVNLNLLAMDFNMLTGSIPVGIGKLNKMGKLSLEGNKLYGEILDSLCNMTQLSVLDLSENNLEGSIPSCLENCKRLQFVQLQNNNLAGTLPKQLSNLLTLINVGVRNNCLSGNLPMEVGHLQGLQRLDISDNHFSGEIPSSLGSCIGLEFLSLSGNHFHGLLPSTLSSVHGLRRLDVSRNNLSGKIPEYLENFSLEYLNLSFNNFEGEVPRTGIFANASAISAVNNAKLCGGIQELQLPTCPQERPKKAGTSHVTQNKVVIAAVLVIIAVCYFFLASFLWLRKSRKKPSSNPSSSSSSASSLVDPFMDVSYAELLIATDGFSSSNLIGMGSYGSVYKGSLRHLDDSGDTVVAIKVLNLSQEGALKSFMVECQALRNIRHRNLIKILTCCSSIDFRGNDFKALVFEYMPHGSLQNWLSKDNKGNNKISGKYLKLIERLNIAIDVASALDYLHYHCQPPIVHRDLKPSNILLDADMVARVGDFGLARFASAIAQSSTIGMRGSIGYIAPEYAMGGKASIKADVYSYGILVLEMMTGKGPTDGMFENNHTLHHHVRSALLADQVTEIVDPCLLCDKTDQVFQVSNDSNKKMRKCLGSIAQIGVMCSAESPGERMKMNEVVAQMNAIRDLYLGILGQGKQITNETLTKGSSYLSNY